VRNLGISKESGTNPCDRWLIEETVEKGLGYGEVKQEDGEQ